MEEFQELLVVVTEAFAEHHAGDHIGHGAAEQECGVKWFDWKTRESQRNDAEL